MGTILDLHVHSVFSVDSPVEPEEYVDYLVALRGSSRIDGLVFCEHRRFVGDFDYEALAEKYGVLVLAGAEAETRWGHLLVYCADVQWMRGLNFEQKFDPVELSREVEAHQGIVVPAHPFRGMLSMGMGERLSELPYLYALEAINGANQLGENERAIQLARQLGLAEVGGSDAHFLEELGKGLTGFQAEIHSMAEMIQEIKAKRVRAFSWNELYRGSRSGIIEP